MVFGETISAIGDTGMPEYVELTLLGVIMQPIKPHDVDSFGPFLLDGVIENSTGSDIVSLHGGGWLWVAHFIQGHV